MSKRRVISVLLNELGVIGQGILATGQVEKIKDFSDQSELNYYLIFHSLTSIIESTAHHDDIACCFLRQF